MSGWMPRDREARPISTDVCRSGTTSGRPGEGSGSVLCWSAYQSGSIHTSATHASASGGAVFASGGWPPVAGAGAGATGRGSEPVVKS